MCLQTQEPNANEEVPPIEDLPPSVKLVYKTLEYEGSLTQKALVEETRLPTRTTRDALTRLQRHGYVEERAYRCDGRQRLYVLTVEP